MSKPERDVNGFKEPKGLERLAGLVDRVMGEPRTMAVMAFVSVASSWGR